MGGYDGLLWDYEELVLPGATGRKEVSQVWGGEEDLSWEGAEGVGVFGV